MLTDLLPFAAGAALTVGLVTSATHWLRERRKDASALQDIYRQHVEAMARAEVAHTGPAWEPLPPPLPESPMHVVVSGPRREDGPCKHERLLSLAAERAPGGGVVICYRCGRRLPLTRRRAETG